MKKFASLLIAFLVLFAMPAQALRIDNCDDVPRTVKVYFPGKLMEYELAPGQGRYLSGLPIQLGHGDQIIDFVRYDDEWCVWNGKLRIQKRNSHRRG